MKIISTNLGKPTKIIWNSKEVLTGIYKKPTDEPIYLAKNDVINDEISDRKHHGGFYKACYLFSSEQYPYWKNLYPKLDWNWGMFGENLTVSDFDESSVFLGDVYKVGDAVVQVSDYREPCYKLGYKFGDQKVLKQFIEKGFTGTYLSVLEEGFVANNDQFTLIERPDSSLTLAELFHLVYAKEKNQRFLKIAANNKALDPKKRKLLAKHIV
ncbi:MOSC domain-containing protein [Salegentibacter salegens]|uniref:MOSC domain-containing protein YiiM n=1 Tax=Salegentibacter salegens TaxID=143223 RepID=A0A1M7JPN4_9FLAO|nr:MOSC domain-containing protein [Salegentibacter salegens]PRX51875.1 MOSC domain-containing protein YiiM [Salegentibacter salegens]SHM54507.1 MOSC domain-containing protein YiiM [Salegentibacter salegens]